MENQTHTVTCKWTFWALDLFWFCLMCCVYSIPIIHTKLMLCYVSIALSAVALCVCDVPYRYYCVQWQAYVISRDSHMCYASLVQASRWQNYGFMRSTCGVLDGCIRILGMLMNISRLVCWAMCYSWKNSYCWKQQSKWSFPP